MRWRPFTGCGKIRPVSEGSRIFLWYGLDKLKNEIFLKNQDDEDEVTPKDSLDAMSKEDLLADLFADLTSFNEDSARKPSQVPTEAESLSYENCRDILLPAFEAGPENGLHHFAVFNNRKAVKNSGVIKLENFEKRIGTRMSGTTPTICSAPPWPSTRRTRPPWSITPAAERSHRCGPIGCQMRIGSTGLIRRWNRTERWRINFHLPLRIS